MADPTKTATRWIPGWAAFSPGGDVWADTFALLESDSWLELQSRNGRSLALMEDEGWTVRKVHLVVNPGWPAKGAECQ